MIIQPISYVLVPNGPISATSSLACALLPSSYINGWNSNLVLANDDSVLQPQWQFSLTKIKFENDEVVRVLDANSVKLAKNGVVGLAAISTPSGYTNDNFRYPDCMTKSPSSKLKQLLPKSAKVQVKIIGDTSVSKPRALIVIKGDGKLVNAELVKDGYARAILRNRESVDKLLPGFSNDLVQMQKAAEQEGRGMFKICDNVEEAADDQFEPLEYTAEIQYGDDGGKQVVRKRDEELLPPADPTPRSRAEKLPICADFPTFEDSLRYFEKYYPLYGDVAKLDRNGDGIPCSGLPHTTNGEKYRMKKPSSVIK